MFMCYEEREDGEEKDEDKGKGKNINGARTKRMEMRMGSIEQVKG